jgi:hypothetical protein
MAPEHMRGLADFPAQHGDFTSARAPHAGLDYQCLRHVLLLAVAGNRSPKLRAPLADRRDRSPLETKRL